MQPGGEGRPFGEHLVRRDRSPPFTRHSGASKILEIIFIPQGNDIFHTYVPGGAAGRDNSLDFDRCVVIERNGRHSLDPQYIFSAGLSRI